jgi:small subunit ribosomal protein S7
MPRKKEVAFTEDGRAVDPEYRDPVVAKFITRMMYDGKKALSTRIMYDALETTGKKAKKEPLEVFLKALDNVKPVVEVKSRRVGGSTYQVPVEIREQRREALAMRWMIKAARARTGSTMANNLAAEILDAYNSTGTAFKKKEDTHRMAEANKAFSHYRW